MRGIPRLTNYGLRRKFGRLHPGLAVALAAVLTIVVALPAGANPPERFEDPFWLIYPESDNNLAVFTNITREDICTPAVVDWEQKFAKWLDSGMVGDRPSRPSLPFGLDPISVQLVETGSGAVVASARGSDLTIELWHLDADEDRLFVGPCTDTDDGNGRFAAGTADYSFHNNDAFGTSPGAEAATEKLRADVTAANGDEYSYTSTFHYNDRCFTPEDGDEACLVDRSTLRLKR
ncbi:MAG: hypothetical protein OEM97_08260 [Acidimicrobiia bacterium]|nr:hypothetical protein [Acidimicrobiia bacterium]